jgi:S-adenosylmethionine:tRNA ribosyltransferase-isomerase
MNMKRDLRDTQQVFMKDYTYELPGHRIAAYPLRQRDKSKLLVYKDGSIEDSVFYRLDGFLSANSLMLLNDTRVVQARLEFFKTTGARIEIFCLNPLKPHSDVERALAQTGSVSWLALVGNAKKWKSDALVIEHPDHSFCLRAHMEGQSGDGYIIRFEWEPKQMSFGEILEAVGKTPLPPYIARPAETGDKLAYQCVFARNEGSVAAPTAGLHFTPDIMKKIAVKGVETAFLTLHVGAGTFKPVTSHTIDGHTMHQEEFRISTQLLQSIIHHVDTDNKYQHKKEIVCVGTTSMRTLESLYWLGARLLAGDEPQDDVFYLSQWAPYEWKDALPESVTALKALEKWAQKRKLDYLNGNTAMIIVPGYPFQLTDVLITNFHLPGSTLLLLVAAFAGPGWKDIYHHALANDYRFLSYGDACLLHRHARHY